MKNQGISKKMENRLSKLLLSEGEVISKICRDGSNELLFQLSQYIVTDKKSPTYGLPLYGLFGCLNGKYYLLCTSFTREMIESEFAEFVAQYAT
jgi:hypothetical protein